MNLRIIFRVLGLLLLVEGVALLISLGVALLYGGGDEPAFLYSALLCFVPGFVAILLTKNANTNISKREGFLAVTLVWVVFSFFGSLPYIISGTIPQLSNAFFETMSGFTTTGATVLNNIEEMPHGILFWRSFTQWLGGMGFIVLTLSVMPVFGIGGMQLFIAEVPGPTPDKISPKIHQTARVLWGLYLAFTVVQTILLRIGGMDWFDGICHSFTTMATGGFSTKQASIGYWDSPFIQYVITFFMIIAGTNFTVSYLVLLKGQFSKLYKDEEFKYYIFFIAAFTLLIFGGLLGSTTLGVEKAFRDSLFQVVTIITTTGYATVDYLLWPPVLTALLFTVFFFGGSAGSTGGGIKIMRIVILLKNSYYEMKRIIHPNAIIPVRFNNHAVDPKIVTNVLAFFMIYLLIFAISTIILMLVGPDLDSAMGAVATSLGNIGPGLGVFGPAETFLPLHPFGKWFLSFLMLLGRLELFTVLVIFSPVFWKG